MCVMVETIGFRFSSFFFFYIALSKPLVLWLNAWYVHEFIGFLEFILCELSCSYILTSLCVIVIYS